MKQAAIQVFNTMTGDGSSEAFVTNENIWLNVYPGEKHGFDAWIRRFWNIMLTLSRDRQQVEYSEEEREDLT